VEEANIAGWNRYLCRLNNFFSNGLTLNNSHIEILQALGGNFEADAGILHITNTLVNLAGDVLPGDGTAVHHAVTIFRGGTLSMKNSTLTYYSAGFGAMSFSAQSAIFDNVALDFLPINSLVNGQTQYRHCKYGAFTFGEGERIDYVLPNSAADQRPLFVTDMDYITGLTTRDIYNSFTRKKINRTAGTNVGGSRRGLKDAQLMYLGNITVSNIQNPDNALGYTHCEFTLSTSSEEYKMLQVADVIVFPTTNEFGMTNVMTTFGTVQSKSAGTIVIKQFPRGTTTIPYDLFLYKPQQLILPFATMNITSGSPNLSGVIIEGSGTQLPTGITINSPYFPEGTYLVSYDGAGNGVASNNATATKTNVDLLSSDWQGIIYGGPPDPAQTDKIGFKQGDIIWNVRTDIETSVVFWTCTTSGITNTSRSPAFRPFFKQQPPQLVDDATADAYGITFYYNTTSSVHRFKNGATWYDVPISNFYTADGTLSSNRSVAGNGKSLSLGTGGSALTNLVVTGTGATTLFTALIFGVDVYSADAIHTVPANVTEVELNDGSLTANRVITLPAATVNGTTLIVINKGNNASFFYTFGSTVTDNSTGGTITNIGHRTTYFLHYDSGLGWRIILKY
jgi:hypothetical protein